MDPVLLTVLAVLGVAAIAAAGPWVLTRLPEPQDPEPDKIPYADVARIGGARWWMIVPAAACAALVAWRIDTPELVPAWILVCGVGSWLGFVDWHTRYLPFRLTAPLYVGVWLLVALAALLLHDHRVLLRALIANLIVYAIFWLIYWIGRRFFGGALGFGDVRLSAVLAVVLGPLGRDTTMVGIYAGFVLGAVFGVLLQRLKVIERGEIAFGPYLLLGAALGAAWGPALYS